MIRRHYPVTCPIVKTIVRKDSIHHRSMSWKIAYGDLMTAMMAFFLLLWLYSNLTNKQKTEIAYYFTPTQGLVGQSGVGLKGGKDSTQAAGTANAYNESSGIARQQLQQGELPEAPQNAPAQNDAADAASQEAKAFSSENPIAFERAFMELQDQVKQLVSRTDNSLFNNNVLIDNSQQDLHISLLNTLQNPMFDDSRDELSTSGIQAMDVIAKIAQRTQRKMIITGYTTTPAFATSNHEEWEAAVKHANLVVRFMLGRHMESHCIERVTGKSETLPMGSERQPEDRVIITLLRDACSH